jgi:hypothetical protein
VKKKPFFSAGSRRRTKTIFDFNSLDAFQTEKSQKRRTDTKDSLRRTDFLLENGTDSGGEDASPFDHFDDEVEVDEESRESCPVHRKPCEKRNYTDPCCVKKNIHNTHNTKDCNHADKKPSDLSACQIRSLMPPCVPYEKNGNNAGPHLGNRVNTDAKGASGKPRSTFCSEKGKKGKGKGKGEQPYAKGNRHRLFCAFCKKMVTK